jgi:hypothetical protein
MRTILDQIVAVLAGFAGAGVSAVVFMAVLHYLS